MVDFSQPDYVGIRYNDKEHSLFLMDVEAYLTMDKKVPSATMVGEIKEDSGIFPFQGSVDKTQITFLKKQGKKVIRYDGNLLDQLAIGQFKNIYKGVYGSSSNPYVGDFILEPYELIPRVGSSGPSIKEYLLAREVKKLQVRQIA